MNAIPSLRRLARRPTLETLESQLAPAAVVTFMDVDGDLVVVTTSKGAEAELEAILTLSDANPANPRQLQTINFSANAALFAGVNHVSGKFADGDDIAVVGGNAAIVSKIASVVIKGEALGTLASVNNTDHFGFVAQQIGSFAAGGVKIALVAGTGNDLPAADFAIGATGDLRVREVAI